ncbi:MAG: LamG domain-containing protein, partial [Kiritimatiellae bacterium]|nr:LamG domain-containing protein [Kiritimatiellia bacterium]
SGGGGGGWGCDETYDGGGAGGCGCVVVRVHSGVESPDPSGRLLSYALAGENTLELDYFVWDLGAGAQSCEAILRYGFSADNLDRSAAVDTLEEGWTNASATVSGFLPNTVYFARLYLDNGEEGSEAVAISDVFSFNFYVKEALPLPTVAYWPFGGTGLADYSDNGNDLAANSHVNLDNDDNCAILDGAQDYFCTPSAIDMSGVGDMTIECWVKFDRTEAINNAGFFMPFEFSPDCNNCVTGFYLDYNELGGRLLCTWRTNGGYFQRCSTDSVVLGDNEWHHIALVFRPSARSVQALRMFIDKVEYFEYGGAGQAWPTNDGYTWSNYQLFVGSRNNSAYKYKGAIDDIRIVAEALEPDDFVERSVLPVPGSASPLAKIGMLKVSGATETAATASYRVSSIGNGAGELFLTCRLSHDGIVRETAVTNSVVAKGEYAFDVENLAPGTRYEIVLYGTNDVSDAVVAATNVFSTAGEKYPAGVNSTPGFRQGRAGVAWSDGFDIAGNPDVCLCDGAWAAHIGNMGPSLNASLWVEKHADGTSSQGYWPNLTTYGYETWMMMEAGTAYDFYGYFDDDVSIWVDDDEVVAFGYMAGAVLSKTYTPALDGWHRIRIYAGNGTGGFGPLGDHPGACWSTDGGATWNYFANLENGDTLFYLVDDEAAVVTGAYVSGANTSYTLKFREEAAGQTVYVYAASSYIGADPDDWGEPVASGTIDSSGTATLLFATPPGVEYYKFAASDGGYTWSTKAVLAEDAEEIDDSEPSIALVQAVGGVGSAEITVNVLSTGAGAQTVDIVASYGFRPGEADGAQTFADIGAGGAKIVISGLSPGHDYYISLHAENGAGAQSEETGVFMVSTRKVPLNIAAAPGTEGFSSPGLWQVMDIGSYVASWQTHPSRVLTLGTFAADSYWLPPNYVPDWQVTLLDGTVATDTWKSVGHFTYTGYMYMTDEDYLFYGGVDDTCEIYVDGQTVVYGSGTGLFTPPDGEGWYEITVKAGDNGGAAGPPNNALPFGVAWHRADEDWQRLLDSGDGSLLRTYPGVRDGRVSSYSVSGDALWATLELGARQSTATAGLYLAYGADFGGDDFEDWENSVKLADITAADSVYELDGAISGAGSAYRFAKFYVVDSDGAWQWCGDAMTLYSEDKPLFGDTFSIDGTEGDGIRVGAEVVSPGNDAYATLKVYVSTNADMSGAAEWICPDAFAAGDTIDFRMHENDTQSPRYIHPDSRYYARLVLEGENGEIDVSPTIETATMGAAAYDAASTWCDDANAFAYFGGTLAKTGARHEATVFLYTGPDANALTNTASTVVTADNTAFSFTVEFPAVEIDVYFKFVISNDCESATWIYEDTTYSRHLRDQFVYCWRSDVLSGDWEDSSNWQVDGDPPQATWPNSPYCAVLFDRCDPAEKYTVSLSGYYNVNALYFRTAGLDVTIAGTGWQQNGQVWSDATITPKSGLYQHAWWQGMQTDLTLTFKDIYLNSTGFAYNSSDRTRIVLDGAYADLRSESALNASSNVLELKNGAVLRETWANFHMNGTSPRLIVDDSIVWFPSAGRILFYALESAQIDILGANPLVWIGESEFSNAAGYVKPHIVFHVPEGGYATAPVVCRDSVFLSSDSDSVAFEIAEDSPARRGGRKFVTTLVDSPYGINAQAADLVQSSFGEVFCDGEPPVKIMARIVSSGFAIFVK